MAPLRLSQVSKERRSDTGVRQFTGLTLRYNIYLSLLLPQLAPLNMQDIG